MTAPVETAGSNTSPAETVVAIVGPTAVGKTAVAVELAEMTGAEIVSADSMAVYRGMNIGTAKPSAAERRRAVFHLVDVADPREGFSAGRFEQLAVAQISDILSRGRMALLVGGTGLYVRAALDGLDTSAAPPDRQLRTRLEAEAAKNGNEALLERLRQVDPETASRLHARDLKRIIRALEIYEIVGEPASRVYRLRAGRKPNFPNARLFGLTMKRGALYARIEGRVEQQIADGLVDEVRRLLDLGIGRDCVAMQGLGYKEIAASLLGELSMQDAVALVKRNTRRFAKRQWTWFRADKRVQWIEVDDLSPRQVAERISAELGLAQARSGRN